MKENKGMNMRILMYCWKAYNQFDLVSALEKRGHWVDEITGEMSSFEEDNLFLTEFRKILDINKYDMVLSINFFPIISNECELRSLRYISWCCDSPISTMYNECVFNKMNTIFTFDKWNQLEFEGMGAPVYHLPLCTDVERVDKIIEVSKDKYEQFSHDIVFVGSMYNKNLYDEVYEHFTEYEKGYFDAALKIQTNLYCDYILDDILDGSMLAELSRHFIIAKSSKSFQNLYLSFSTTILGFKIAQMERQKILTELSEKFNVDIYTDDEKYEYMRVKKHKTVDYWSEAPLVYRNSKINLNITLRSIRTGIPLRVWDILGAGGFCITNYQAELLLYFENGKDLVIFESMEDLNNKIEYYLTHEDERKAIAMNGYKKVKELHQYSNRIDEMNLILEDIKL